MTPIRGRDGSQMIACAAVPPQCSADAKQRHGRAARAPLPPRVARTRMMDHSGAAGRENHRGTKDSTGSAPQADSVSPPSRQTDSMKSLMMLWICASASAALTACGMFQSTKPPPPKAKPATEAPKLIGRIASIPADKRFVLVQSYGNLTVVAGTIFTTRGPEGRTANLLATGESLGQFSAADVQSGHVKVGDAVYSRHVPPPTPPPSAPETIENEKTTTF